MRYDMPCEFVSTTETVYNEKTGDYDTPRVLRERRYAAVYDTSRKTMQLLYGDIREESLTVHIQGHVPFPIAYIVIAGKKYHVDKVRSLRAKETFIVSEVPE